MFAAFDPNKVTKIYMGLDRHCRCGCGGEYVSRGEPMFDKRLARFTKLACDYVPQQDDEYDNYANISYGKNRALTVYFD
jgi:hypothetical protein